MPSPTPITNCSRCGKNHAPGLLFQAFRQPITVGGEEFTHWASCPENREPVLMRQCPPADLPAHFDPCLSRSEAHLVESVLRAELSQAPAEVERRFGDDSAPVLLTILGRLQRALGMRAPTRSA